MGKNSAIKSLSRVIGNVSFHKFLLEHSNKPESINHLKHEISEYSADALEKVQEFNWNDSDKIIIREKSLQRARNISKNYSDIIFNELEIESFINQTMEDVGL